MGDLGARLSTHVATQKRLERLESLFQELADETREHRDAHDLDELRARLSDVEALTLETGSGLRDQQATLRTLRESIKPPPIAPGSGDDLTRIKGIGPKYARLLAQIGVTTIAQVAAWSDADLEVAAIELSINPARIRKAGWIDNAKALLAG
ncbi:MAG: DUF4332 domain-containing protein [Sandaracinaceae bacterium]|nr:DUF4332 domain-containing protein [Sandaracinaceae bacterium]